MLVWIPRNFALALLISVLPLGFASARRRWSLAPGDRVATGPGALGGGVGAARPAVVWAEVRPLALLMAAQMTVRLAAA